MRVSGFGFFRAVDNTGMRNPERLRGLTALRKDGLISQEEYLHPVAERAKTRKKGPPVAGSDV